ncbi:MAG: BON domain-containing protein [Acidobacteriia bacterium]|nr:BON domain-containing protein [Terriglobia bacterium]
MTKRRFSFLAGFLALLLSLGLSTGNVFAAPGSSPTDKHKSPQLTYDRSSREAVSQGRMSEQIRHRLAMLPWYGVFDWLSYEMTPDGTVVLRGEVVKPVTKSDAQSTVMKVEGVRSVANEIEVLPPSPFDERLRFAVYRAILRLDSPVFLYSSHANPSLHIIVDGGHVTLKGVVARRMDSQLAYNAAMGVPGVFSVNNQLQVEHD